MSVDAGVVFFARPTTLIGAGDFSTAPLDVSGFTGVQFQAWRGAFESAGPPTPSMTLYLEESLDARHWVLGPATPEGVVLTANENFFFSYSFRLRWFRVRVTTVGASLATLWAEGLLRGGGAGLWGRPPASGRAGGVVAPALATGAIRPPAGRMDAGRNLPRPAFAPRRSEPAHLGFNLQPTEQPFQPQSDPTLQDLLRQVQAAEGQVSAPDGTVPPPEAP